MHTPRKVLLAAIGLALLCGPPAIAHQDPDERIQALSGQIGTHPQDRGLRFRRADLLRDIGQLDAALADLVIARPSPTDSANEVLVAARVYHAKGNPLAALEVSDKQRTDPRIALVRARAWYALDRCEEALAAYDLVLLHATPGPELQIEADGARSACGGEGEEPAAAGLPASRPEIHGRAAKSGGAIPQVPISTGTTVRYRANTSDPAIGMTWTAPGFDDSSWSWGQFPLGYAAGPMVATTVPLTTSSVFARTTFQVSGAAAVQTMHLGCDYDDAYAVWLNGVEVYRAPELPAGALAWNTPASANHESSNGVLPNFTPRVDLSVYVSLLVEGTNSLAVGVWNVGPSSSDLVIAPDLALDRPVAVTRGPYLQQGTDTSIVVRWRTDVPTTSRVDYGDAVGNLTESVVIPGSRTEHVVPVSGLGADTMVFYALYSASGRMVGDDAGHHFVTAPTPGTDRPTRVWVLGDCGTADGNQIAVRDGYIAYNAATYTDLLLLLGDNAYNDGKDAEYQQAIFNMYPQTLRSTPVWPTAGNHDSYSSSALTQTGPYYDMFTLPTNAEAGGFPSLTEAYYSFDHGDIHFVVLESQESNRTPTGPMLTWLVNDLAQSSSRWTIAYWHHPPYSKGSHDSDTDLRMTEMRQHALPILESGGVDLVLVGHSHSYERSYLIDGHYGLSSTLAPSMLLDDGDGRIGGDGAYKKPPAGGAPHAGTVHVVAGASGKTGGGTLDHPVMFVSVARLGSVVLDIDRDQLDLRYVDTTAGVFDAFTILRTDPPVGVALDPQDRTRWLRISPNPTDRATTLELAVLRAEDASVRIFDLRGRLVRSLHAGPLAEGSHRLAWDGADDAGQSVAQGVYLLELRTPSQTDRRKITILR